MKKVSSSTNPSPPEKQMRQNLLAVSSNFIAGMGLLAFLGYQLDVYLQHKPYLFTLLGLFLGFAWGMYETFKIVRRLNQPSGSAKK